jgi:hypothetical protein
LGYPAAVGGYWSSGLPTLNATVKNTSAAWDGGLQLPLFVADVGELRDAVRALPEEAWGREYQVCAV